MADEDSLDDKTEEATPERREDFREKGQVAVSREITSVLVLGACVIFYSAFLPAMVNDIRRILIKNFRMAASVRIGPDNIMRYAADTWTDVLYLVLPTFLVTAVVASSATLLQTRFNWSWQKLQPDFSRMNPLSGLKRMFDMHAGVELLKAIAKMLAVGLIAFLILRGEWVRVPALMVTPFTSAWGHWGEITGQLFWSVAGLLMVIGAGDYFYNFISLERKMRMSKQEIKEEYKRRETDPHVKGRMRRMQRDIASRKMLDKAKEATVIITNPTHYAIALKYELGMRAPRVVAKGVDFLAQRIKEQSKELNIPIVENKPLARTLYKLVEVGHDIPESLYKAVSEIIRYVFSLKGIRVGKTGTK